MTVITWLWLTVPKLAVRVKEGKKPLPTLKVNMAEAAFAAIVIELSVDRAGSLTVNPTVVGDDAAELSLTV